MSSFIEGKAREVLGKAKDKAEDRIRQSTNVKAKAAVLWAKLNEPINIGNNLWLSIAPKAAYSGSPTLVESGQFLSLPIALEATPLLLAGPKPKPVQTPLPDLVQAPLDPHFVLNLRGTATYHQISRILREEFAEEELTLGTHWPLSEMNFIITDVEVRGSGNQVVIAVSIDGFAKGTLYLFGTPVFRQEPGSLEGTLAIENVKYSIETANILVNLGNIIFHNRLEERIQAAAQLSISRQLKSAYSKVNAAINRDISSDARLSGSITDFGPGLIWISNVGLEAIYPIRGQLTVVASPF